METKRNKPLWQAISVRLENKGFNRTPEQCKSKWKNLATRFKGSEATEGEGSRQFPFYEEMRRIFSERMEKLLALNKDKGKGVQVQEEDQWGEEEEEEQEEEKLGEIKKKRKVERKRESEGEVENALREFARRQLEMEARWIEAAEAREAERRAKEEEWRRAMEALEEERIVMETRWREREEERRAREEARAERRDALVTALLAKLRKEGL
ncbi:putative Trihelix transcription factor GT-3b [Cocos nucifera]|uniref:Putative Trihelix transcription factor GT-3b n=1 Tax=Cocos nucifera TaxID=13894 RepID=A0A8K0NE16_COCNU|nr:putative Trihelix transcription factor GT-3b [Cocos nucifera]